MENLPAEEVNLEAAHIFELMGGIDVMNKYCDGND
jgi:hypothetical protein